MRFRFPVLKLPVTAVCRADRRKAGVGAETSKELFTALVYQELEAEWPRV